MQRYFQQVFFCHSRGTFKRFGLVEDFLALCRKEIVERQLGHITPKLHLLQHPLALMTTVSVGIGLLGERGAKSIHTAFNNYENDFKNIPLASQRLKTITDQNLLSCVTDINTLRPVRVPRKKTASKQ